MPTILHCADLHLEAPFARMGTLGRQLREGAKKTLDNIVQLAIERKVNLVIIAGDLANTNSLSQKTREHILLALKRLTMPVVILPGTHDCLDKNSIYRSPVFGELQNVHIIMEEKGQTFFFEDSGIAVHGKPNMANRDKVSPLAGLAAAPDYHWNIAVAHGSLQIEGKSAEDDYPITEKEIEQCGMDYLALGHWHKLYQGQIGQTVFCYSGSASTLKLSEDRSGFVCLVELAEAGVQVSPVKVAHYEWKTVKCTSDALSGILEANRGKQVLLFVEVTDRPGDEGVIEKYRPEYFYLEVSQPGKILADVDLAADYPETTFAGQFVRLADELMAHDPELGAKVKRTGLEILYTGEVE